MVWVEAGNWSALQSKLTAGPWHVLHVIAHGGVSDRGGVLALENEATGVRGPGLGPAVRPTAARLSAGAAARRTQRLLLG